MFVQIYYVSYRCPPALAIPTPQSTYGVSAEELIEASRHVKIDWVLEQGNVEELAGKLKTGIIVFVCIYLFFARWLLASCSRFGLAAGFGTGENDWVLVVCWSKAGWVGLQGSRFIFTQQEGFVFCIVIFFDVLVLAPTGSLACALEGVIVVPGLVAGFGGGCPSHCLLKVQQ